MPTIHARHPTGFLITFDDVDRDRLNDAVTWLLEHGYQPDLPGDGWRRTPSGEPLCGKHGVAMAARSKQNQNWYSHRIILESGEERYCRGYKTGRPDDGYLI